MKNRDAVRYRVIETGKKIKATAANSHGAVKCINTGRVYTLDEVKYLGERRHDVRVGFHIWRIGVYLFAREYLKYHSWVITPSLSIDTVNGYDCYVDFEVKFLCVGGGVRFIWIKRKKA